MGKILWRGRRSAKSFYDMIFCGSLLIVISMLTPVFISLPNIEFFALFGMMTGAFLILLSLLLSLSFKYIVTEDSGSSGLEL